MQTANLQTNLLSKSLQMHAQKNVRKDIPGQAFDVQQTHRTNVSSVNNAPRIAQEGIDEASLHEVHDHILPGNASTKVKVAAETALSIPDYAKRGLKGDPDANFHEFLKLGKLAYYVGGAALTGVYMIGRGGLKGNIKAQLANKAIAKKVGAGVLGYYLMSAIARKAVDIPVKLARGIDLTRPYKDVVDLRTQSKDGASAKKVEYHKVYESTEFTRWDLLYKDNQQNPDKVNENFDTISKKMGIDEKLNDSDSTVKSEVKKLLKQATAWKYLLTVPAVAFGVGVGNQESMAKFGSGLTRRLGVIFTSIKENGKLDDTSLKFKNADFAKQAGTVLKQTIIDPLASSLKSFWTGNGTKASKYAGKITILSGLALTLLANIHILSSSSKSERDAVDVSEANA